MKISEQPRAELSKANSYIEGMRGAKSLDEFEDNWKNYLHRLERIWNKTSNHYSKSPKWNGWKGKYEQLRKNDPLLSYFINARGADEHTVNEITSRKPGGFGIKPSEGTKLIIDEMKIDRGNISIKSPHGIRIDFIPAKTVLVPVTNRGRTYPIPTLHLGKTINPNNVVEIAEIGIHFYQTFLNDVESSFVKKIANKPLEPVVSLGEC